MEKLAIPVITFEQRVAKVKTVSDIDKQIDLAKATVTRLRNKAKNARTLAEKLALQDAGKRAGDVFRRFRMNAFDLEDKLNDVDKAGGLCSLITRQYGL